jgi:hypothetical protein
LNSTKDFIFKIAVAITGTAQTPITPFIDALNRTVKVADKIEIEHPFWKKIRVNLFHMETIWYIMLERTNLRMPVAIAKAWSDFDLTSRWDEINIFKKWEETIEKDFAYIDWTLAPTEQAELCAYWKRLELSVEKFDTKIQNGYTPTQVERDKYDSYKAKIKNLYTHTRSV